MRGVLATDKFEFDLYNGRLILRIMYSVTHSLIFRTVIWVAVGWNLCDQRVNSVHNAMKVF